MPPICASVTFRPVSPLRSRLGIVKQRSGVSGLVRIVRVQRPDANSLNSHTIRSSPGKNLEAAEGSPAGAPGAAPPQPRSHRLFVMLPSGNNHQQPCQFGSDLTRLLGVRRSTQLGPQLLDVPLKREGLREHHHLLSLKDDARGGVDGAGQGIAHTRDRRAALGSRFFWLLGQKIVGPRRPLRRSITPATLQRSRATNSRPARSEDRSQPTRGPSGPPDKMKAAGSLRADLPGAAWRNAPSSDWRREAPAGARPKEPLLGGGTERDRQALSVFPPKTARRLTAGRCRAGPRRARRRCRRAASHHRRAGCCCPS